MRIPCPFCGFRDSEEFAYLGDATVRRPQDGGAAPTPEWEAYVYLRENPFGPHRELWFHAGGCQSWLVVERDTRTHAISGAAPARDVALERSAPHPGPLPQAGEGAGLLPLPLGEGRAS